MISSRGRGAASLLWRRHSAARRFALPASSSTLTSWPISATLANNQNIIIGNHPDDISMATRQFSAKNRKRKEEKRRKRALKKQQQLEEVEDDASTATTTTPTTTTQSPPLVTQTKASGVSTTTAPPPTIQQGGITVAPAPPEDDEDEEVFEGKQAMPDREKETELIRHQTQVSALYKEGRYKEGLELAEETLQAMEEHFGVSHPATASAQLNVGLFHKQLGDFGKAKTHYEASLQAYKDTVGTDHASYATVLHNLGMLYQSQIHFDSDLKLTDRLRLIKEALEYLEEAYKILSVELPKDHPLVVATQSALGMTLTTHILHLHKPVSQKQQDSSKQTVVPTAASYRSVLPPQVTEQSWEAAEDHLRKALDKALRNPRGESSLKRGDKNHYLNIQKKQNLSQKHGKRKNKDNEEVVIPPLQTGSAATAAQNLAVFLKARSTTVDTVRPQYKAWVKEAQDMYQTALQVRMALLPKGHPDIYITQYSLAELYEYTGQEKLAQALRQTILDTYDPPQKKQQQQQQQES